LWHLWIQDAVIAWIMNTDMGMNVSEFHVTAIIIDSFKWRHSTHKEDYELQAMNTLQTIIRASFGLGQFIVCLSDDNLVLKDHSVLLD